MKELNHLKYHLLVLLASSLVAGSFIISEKLAGIIHPVSLTLLRFAGASIILMPIVLFRAEWRSKVISTLPRAVAISFFYAIFFIGLFESLTLTTSLNTGTLFTLVPLITALLSIIVFRDSMTNTQLLLYLLGMAGTCWVVFSGQLNLLLSFSLNRGDVIFLAAIVCMSLYSISMKYLYRNDQMIVLVFCTLIGGAFWMALALFITGQPLEWQLIESHSLLQMLYLIVAATLVTVYIYQITTVALGPSRVNAYIFLNPALVAILLMIFDGVIIPLSVLPGILLSVLVTIILQYRISQNRLMVQTGGTKE